MISGGSWAQVTIQLWQSDLIAAVQDGLEDGGRGQAGGGAGQAGGQQGRPGQEPVNNNR